MVVRFSPAELRQSLSAGLMAFPLSDFSAADELDLRSYRERLDWHSGFGVCAMVPAAGAGEFFSITRDEYGALLAETIAARLPGVPVIAPVGFGTKMAIDYARHAEEAGADGLLLLPPYLTEASQAGIAEHILAVCAAVSIGVIVYNRANCRLSPAAMRHIAERATNFVGLKDGHGDLVSLQAAKSSLGDRLVFINGMPTAENFATAYFGLGIRTYSSAIFNFAPASAMSFYNAVQHRDEKAVSQFVEQFLVPYGQIRDKQPGYAVSIVKAGVDIVGRSAGKVRPPLSSLASEEYAQLKELIAALGPQVPQVS